MMQNIGILMEMIQTWQIDENHAKQGNTDRNVAKHANNNPTK